MCVCARARTHALALPISPPLLSVTQVSPHSSPLFKPPPSPLSVTAPQSFATALRPPPPPLRPPFSVTTPQSFATALLSLPVYATSGPLARLMAMFIMPASFIIAQNTSVREAVGLASTAAAVNGSSGGSSGGSSVSLPLPLLMTGANYPVQLGVNAPRTTRFDLAGCVGCLVMADTTVNVYLTQMLVTGG